MKYLAVLGRQPEISIAELEAQFPESFDSTGSTVAVSPTVLDFCLRAMGVPPAPSPVDVKRFGGVLKFAIELDKKPIEYLRNLPEGKITIGISDYSKGASKKTAQAEALKLKKILVRHGRSVRVVENKEATLSTATSLHNGLSGKNERKVELIKVDSEWFRVVGVQDIDAYTRRDQARPARDAKVGMLPPKLAQILINLCGPLKLGSRILDPFCGTGVVLQEAILMGYLAYGTDINERMIEYSKKNLEWLMESQNLLLSGSRSLRPSSRSSVAIAKGRVPRGVRQQPPRFPESKNFEISIGDATSFQWNQPIDAVACESYLGKPFSKVPTEIELKEQKQECKTIILRFLKNLSTQIKKDTPVTIAIPAWLRETGKYERLDILDEISDLGYNVNNKSCEGLLYHREDQIVARDIIILRKK